MAQAAEEALVKIGAVLPEDERARANSVQIHAFEMPEMSDETRARLDVLQAAVDGSMRQALRYADEDGNVTKRGVRPLGLWFWGKVWTLVAWCELREDFRMFRVDRVQDIASEGGFRPERGKTLRDFYALEVSCHGRR